MGFCLHHQAFVTQWVPRGIIAHNMKGFANKDNKPKDPICITIVPEKEIFKVFPYLGFQSKIVTQQLKSTTTTTTTTTLLRKV